MYYVYVLKSTVTGRWYTGSTGNLRKRVSQHNDKRSTSTRGGAPWTLIYYEACIDETDARTREKYLKSGMGKRYLKNRLTRFLTLTG